MYKLYKKLHLKGYHISATAYKDKYLWCDKQKYKTLI